MSQRLLWAGLAAAMTLGLATGEELQARLEIDRKTVYVGERFDLTLVIDASGITLGRTVQLDGLPDTNRVARGDFREMPPERRVEAGQIHERRRYRCAAQAIEPGTVEFRPSLLVKIQMVQRSMFGHTTIERDYRVRLEPLDLNVLSLPTEGVPADFSGAVGRLRFDVTLSPTNMAPGELITARMILHGRADYTDVIPPRITAGAGFKGYEPKRVSSEADAGCTFEQILIPQTNQAATIPAVSFSFFDPLTGTYQTVTKGPFAISFRAPDEKPVESYYSPRSIDPAGKPDAGRAAELQIPENAPTEVIEAVNRAIRALADGVHEAAIEASRQALDRAPDLALLRYNLGICHLRNAQPGPAVLWLRRALWISPRDPHIRQALAMAEETAGAAGDSQAPLDSWAGRLTGREWIAGLAILLMLTVLAGILPRLGQWPRKGAWNLAAGVLMLASATAATAAWQRDRAARTDAVTLTETTARLAPAERAWPSFTLPEGTVVRVLASNGDWLRVRRGGHSGWVPSAGIERVGR